MGVTAEMIEGEGFNPGDLQHRETWNEGEGFGSRDLQYRGTQIGTELAFPSPDENYQASFPPSDHFQTWFSMKDGNVITFPPFLGMPNMTSFLCSQSYF